MVNDPYFEKQMLQDVVNSYGNEWVSELSPEAK
jgi:hypothetical protein